MIDFGRSAPSGSWLATAGQRTPSKVKGLGSRERFIITLTRAGSRAPLVPSVTGRASSTGTLHRRLTLPDLTPGRHRITITVTGRSTRRTDSITGRSR